jgi:hypothetical protein
LFLATPTVSGSRLRARASRVIRAPNSQDGHQI